MPLNFMGSEDAVKFEIPMSAPDVGHSFADWMAYSGVLKTKTHIGQVR